MAPTAGIGVTVLRRLPGAFHGHRLPQREEESTCLKLAAISSLTNNFTGAAAKLFNLCRMHQKCKNYFAVQSSVACWNIHVLGYNPIQPKPPNVSNRYDGLDNLDHWPTIVSVVFIPSNIMLHGLIGDGDCSTMFEISAPKCDIRIRDETLVIFMEIGFVDVKFRRTISTNNQKTAIND
ncbi:hypothetical protein C4D60_Mb01t13230 [Musa balbisiana]|uniref:Uncharacterized protein n=1 Tax=Musa balbisiana TaxID=52838 RepID=A0A4S8JPC7_MUSBA|nr:hypothetical protein C4D60_Mb01t13230 [Musa balbisiana]